MVSNDALENGHADRETTTKKGIFEHFQEELSDSWTDALLLVCCFVTGLLDAAVFNEWSCFVSMQTGNTIYAGLGVTNQPKEQPYRWIMALTSILCYIIGSFIFSRLQRLLQPLRRSTMMASFAAQAVLCFISAVLVETSVVPLNAQDLLPDNLIVLVPIALLSIQAAGQTVVSRILGFSELPTVVLTSTYCDLGFDPELLTAAPSDNHKRNRRLAAVVLLLGGAILGGLMTKGEGAQVTNTLWLCGAIKTALVLVLMGWKRKESVRLR